MQNKRFDAMTGKFLQGSIALAIIVTLALLLPFAATNYGARDFASTVVMAASPRSFTVSAPLQLTRSPSLTLVAGTILLKGGGAGKATARGWRGSKYSGNLLLTNGRFILETGSRAKTHGASADAPPADMVSPLLQALAKFGFDTLNISNTDVVIKSAASPDQKIKTKTIGSISAQLKRHRSGVVDAKGRFQFRNKLVTFNASFAGKSKANSHGLVPLDFELRSDLLNATFKGLAAISSGFQFRGQMLATSSNIRQMAQWLTGDFPNGAGLGHFKVSGLASWVGNKLSFQNASFELDANKATGGLSLDLGKQRPSLEGTLATKSLTLDSFFIAAKPPQNASATAVPKAATSAPSPKKPFDLSLPSIRYIDADIRLSTDAVTFAGYQMGRAAAAISIDAGKLLADIAEIELAGGQGIGQVTADMSGQVPRFSIRSKFDNVDLSQFSHGILGPGTLTGLGKLVLALDGSGATEKQIIRALSGKIHLTLPDGGYIGVDPEAMMLAAKQADVSGWQGLRGSTRLASADASFTAQNGVFRTVKMEATIGKLKISCSGNINLARHMLDLRIKFGKALALSAGSPPRGRDQNSVQDNKPDVLRVYGSWQGPFIRLETTKKKALRPKKARTGKLNSDNG